MKDYAILVNSCDNYYDAWDPFFDILAQTWDSELPALYLNTETRQYSHDKLNIIVLNCPYKRCEWGKRLISSLERIESDYVLMMLEDFFYEQPIKVDIIDKCVRAMKRDTDILSFQLVPASEVYRNEVKINNHDHEGFALREKKGTYTFIAGPTLWRRKDLIKLTRAKDTPWEWEWYGSFRTQLYGKKIYCWKSFDNPIFDYDVSHGGAIHGGKWVGYKVRELRKKYQLTFDMSLRDVEEDWIKNLQQNVEQGGQISRWNKLINILAGQKKRLTDNYKSYINVIYGLAQRMNRK